MTFSLIIFALLWLKSTAFLINNPIVETECGPVEGTKQLVNVFKGIPYAEPPVSNLRWKPPIRKSKSAGTCWNGVFKADTFGNSCSQLSFPDNLRKVGSEDCLYLNVWSPCIDKDANLPVMVFIHGGYLLALNGNVPSYSPTEELARTTNMVYVSFNYRLNAFGFMALDILSEASPRKTSGNYGFMDQILVLKWVQDNIRNFGGDPNLVTLFGQSSGGTSIYALLASPLASGLFHRAWMISASPIMNKTVDDASRDNLVFLKNTGCSDLNCLQQLPAEKVIDAIPWDVYPNWGMADQTDLPIYNLFDGALPVVDGFVLPQSPKEAWRSGNGNDVPVIVSTTAQEIDFNPVPSDIKTWSWNTYSQKVTEKMSAFPGFNVTALLQLYPEGVESPEYQYTSMASDLRLSCPLDELTNEMQQGFNSPVYRYVSTAWPKKPVSLLGIPFKAEYAAHCWDMYAFFGTINDLYRPDAYDESFSFIMRREIVHFAITGTPYSDCWTPFPSGTAIIDDQLRMTDRYNKKQCEFWSSTGLYSYAWIN